jgi:3-oxoacyl-[acyl-carrier protein] reductase
LLGKVAIVTGSNSGIGKAIARRFALEGAKVVIAARRRHLCEEVAARIQTEQGEALAIPTDVTDERQVESLVAATVRRFGRLDILVNNAGIGDGSRIEDTSTEDFDRVLSTNLRGTFFCSRAGFRAMRNSGGGIIINVSSVCGIDAWAGTGAYSASKYAIMGLTKALADEGRSFGIKASAICPGGVADDLVDASPDMIRDSGKINPFDIAETAVYLATLGPHAVVHQIIVDRLGADW